MMAAQRPCRTVLASLPRSGGGGNGADGNREAGFIRDCEEY